MTAWSSENEHGYGYTLVIAAFITYRKRRGMLIWISAAPIPIGYAPTLLLTASAGRDGSGPRESVPKG
jgi:hypothetical protein